MKSIVLDVLEGRAKLSFATLLITVFRLAWWGGCFDPFNLGYCAGTASTMAYGSKRAAVSSGSPSYNHHMDQAGRGSKHPSLAPPPFLNSARQGAPAEVVFTASLLEAAAA